MLLNPFDDRSAGLSNVVIVTVLAGNLVDGVHGVRFRSGSFVGVEEGHQGGGGGKGCRDVVAYCACNCILRMQLHIALQTVNKCKISALLDVYCQGILQYTLSDSLYIPYICLEPSDRI